MNKYYLIYFFSRQVRVSQNYFSIEECCFLCVMNIDYVDIMAFPEITNYNEYKTLCVTFVELSTIDQVRCDFESPSIKHFSIINNRF